MTETWLPVPGYEGLYKVSDMGNVKSLDRVVPRGHTFISLKGKQMKCSAGDRGYPIVALNKNGRREMFTVHRMVLLAFKGPRPDGLIIRHLNDIPTDNRLDNLEYGTYSDNARDKVANGNDPNANKTHCKRGHEFTPENTLTHPSRGRTCKTCQRKKQKDHSAKKQEKSRNHIQRPNTSDEKWLPVVRFEDSYSVSDQGRVRSESRKIRFVNNKSDEHFRLTKQKILNPTLSNGYPRVALGKNKTVRIHVLVAEAFIGPRPDGKYVMHKNDDPCDNWLGNLEYGTPSENQYTRRERERTAA